MSHKIFQTQKGVNFTLPKTYPYMTLSNNTNNLAVLAVCKNFIMMAHFLTPGITVYLLSHHPSKHKVMEVIQTKIKESALIKQIKVEFY